MFKSKLEKFTATRAAMRFLVLSVADLIFLENRWLVLAGLFAGAVISVFKFVSCSWILRRAVDDERATLGKRKTVGLTFVVNMIYQSITLFSLLITYFLFGQWALAGLAAGILLVPFVMMGNAITETLGITKNGFFL